MDQPKYCLMDNDAVSMEDNFARAKWLMTHPRLTMGPMSKAYEEKWLSWINRKYANACNSGSSANLIALSALTSPVFGFVTYCAPSMMPPASAIDATVTENCELGRY